MIIKIDTNMLTKYHIFCLSNYLTADSLPFNGTTIFQNTQPKNFWLDMSIARCFMFLTNLQLTIMMLVQESNF